MVRRIGVPRVIASLPRSELDVLANCVRDVIDEHNGFDGVEAFGVGHVAVLHDGRSEAFVGDTIPVAFVFRLRDAIAAEQHRRDGSRT